jgi:hypothetical protein
MNTTPTFAHHEFYPAQQQDAAAIPRGSRLIILLEIKAAHLIPCVNACSPIFYVKEYVATCAALACHLIF